MSPAARFSGWSVDPPFTTGGPTAPVALAIDETTFIQWIGSPPTVVQTPLTEVHDLEVRVGSRLRVAATIAGVRYHWHARRDADRDDFADVVVAHGGRLVRGRRRFAALVALIALVTLVASAASIVSLTRSTTPASTAKVPTSAAVGAIDLQATDLDASWLAAPNGVLTALVGEGGSVVTSTTPIPKLTGQDAKLWHAVTSNFETCLGVSKAADRMFGSAGQYPAIQVTGDTFATSEYGGSEITSLTQYYASTTMVTKDLAEYSRAGFGRCWARNGAQELTSQLDGTLASANASYLATTFTPGTFARGWRRGGIATLTVPGFSGTEQLVALVAARGHYECDLYALTPNWVAARPSVLAAFESMLARLAPHTIAGTA